MAIVQSRAFVIKTIPFQDTSLIVRMFTESHGKVTLLAKGARNLKSPYRGYLESLSLLEVQFYFKPTRDIQTLSKIETMRGFLYNCTEMRTTFLATAMLECLDKFIRDHHEDAPIFELVLDTLDYMDTHRANSASAFIYFILNLTTLMGYRIDLDSIKKTERSILSVPDNRLEFLKKIEDANIRIGLPDLPEGFSVGEIALSIVNYLAFQMDLPVKLKSLEILSQITQSNDRKE